MILQYEGISEGRAISNKQHNYIMILQHMILHYGGLSAINNIKYHDITL